MGVINLNDYVNEVFDDAGYPDLYDKHQYKFEISGVLDHVDREMLETFLDQYSFEDAEAVYYDEFVYHLRIFKNIYERNGLRYRPW